MKIIMIYDQIQAGAGTKDDKMVPLAAKKEPVGPAVMMEPFLKEIDGRVVACLYCGNGYYLENKEEVTRKLVAMVNKLQPDVVTAVHAAQPRPWPHRALSGSGGPPFAEHFLRTYRGDHCYSVVSDGSKVLCAAGAGHVAAICHRSGLYLAGV